MSEPSDRAIEAAYRAAEVRGVADAFWVNGLLSAAHDPALDLDRSVCLRDVVDRIRQIEDEDHGKEWHHQRDVADAIEYEFGFAG